MYKPQLDGLRFFAFLAVFLTHMPGGWWYGGPVGVYAFFALSGFLITGILSADSDRSLVGRLGTFYARRSIRIFPLYYLTLIWVLAAGALPHAGWYFSYLSNVLVFQSGGFDAAIGHFWSLGVEEQFYLFYPLLLLPCRSSSKLLIGLIVASKLARALLAWYTPAPWYAFLLPACGEYLLWGGLAALWEKRGRPLPFSGQSCAVLGVALVGLYYTLRGAPATEASWLVLSLDGTPDGIGFALIVLGLWRAKESFTLRVLTFAPLVYLGRITYGLYVYHLLVLHGPIGAVFHRWLGIDRLETWQALLFDLPLTIAVAALSWHFFEKPLLRLKDYFRFESPNSKKLKQEVPAATASEC